MPSRGPVGAGVWFRWVPGRGPVHSGSVTAPDPPPPTGPAIGAAWYPDPSGRHEYRYFNGAVWTADVSDDGHRYVDPIDGPAIHGSTPRGSTGHGATGADPNTAGHNTGGNGMAVAAITCGIISLALGWLPFLFVVGAVLAVLAIVFGSVGLRRSRRVGRGRGLAIGGLATGAVGVLVAVGGLVFTIAMVRAIDRYENPEPNTVTVTSCASTGGTAEVTGTLRNDGDRAADFTVLVEVGRAGSGVSITSSRQRVDGVAPGATAEWSFTRAVAIDEIQCSVADVTGPLPFGVVPR